MMDMVLISSIPGTAISGCVQNLIACGMTARDGASFACLEDFLPIAAASPLSTIGYRTPHTLANVLQLPFDTLCAVCSDALSLALAKLSESVGEQEGGRVYLTLHPVLYHQRTSEFV